MKESRPEGGGLILAVYCNPSAELNVGDSNAKGSLYFQGGSDLAWRGDDWLFQKLGEKLSSPSRATW